MTLTEFAHQVVPLSRVQHKVEGELRSRGADFGARDVAAARPAQVQVAHSRGPHTAIVASCLARGLRAVRAKRGEDHPDPGRSLRRPHAPQQDGPAPFSRKGLCFPALHDPVHCDAAAAPDQGALFVVSAGHAAAPRCDGAEADSGDEGGKDRVTVPAGCARPAGLSARAGQCPRSPSARKA
ncbi:hypothetical protein ACIPC1_16485 [Streptomyces sp. NPDC087263]|uniref:hypothetical protein n=1 Tax=Streptomyces sp. NPDC087263 TaxID=3365773 RepID=UPI00382F2DCD